MREYIRFSKNADIHYILSELFNLLETAAVILFCLILLYTYVLDHAQVQGSSMVPTLTDGDKLLMSRIYPEPQNGDVVIIDAQEAALFQEDGTLYTSDGLDKIIVKRVIAVGGQTVGIDFEEGIVYVDDVPLAEDYAAMPTTTPHGGAFAYPITIPEGYVFVLGDNRDISKDSRYSDVGLIHESDIMGKVLFRIAPWESFGLV